MVSDGIPDGDDLRRYLFCSWLYTGENRMNRYAVYQQRQPIGRKTGKLDEKGKPEVEYTPNLVLVGQVQAYTGSHAIDVARDTVTEFKTASRKTLAAYPIVELVE